MKDSAMKKVPLLLATVVLAGSLMGCSGGEGTAYEEKSYTPPEGVEVTGIDIQVTDRKILVVSSEDGQIHIDYAESTKEFYDIAVTDDGVLTMVSRTDKEWTDYVGLSDSAGYDQITVQVPDTLATLVLSTTQEDIVVSAPTVTDRLSLSNNGGDISFEGVGAPDVVEVENKNGNIEGTVASGYDDYAITSAVKKGSSNLPEEKSGGSKTLNVANNNGNIDIEFAGV